MTLNQLINTAFSRLSQQILKRDPEARVTISSPAIKSLQNAGFEQTVADIKVVLSTGQVYNYAVNFDGMSQSLTTIPIVVTH
jgi:hypothetical protein